MKETPHDKRRARARRRFAAVGTILHAIWGEPPPDYALTQDEILGEVETALTGQRRSKGRAAKPQNSNDSVVALIREHRADDFRGRFTAKRAIVTRDWLQANHGIYKSADAVTKMINRAKKKPRK
jgi:hypothetical protein